MRTIMSILVMSAVAVLCRADELSVAAQTLQQQLSSRAPMVVRSWVLSEAQRVHSDPRWEERQVRVDAQARFAGQPVFGPDLDAMVFMILAEVVQRLDWDIRRAQIRVDPARKTAAATNAVAEVCMRQEVELTKRRAKLAGRADELGRQLSPLAGTLLQNLR